MTHLSEKQLIRHFVAQSWKIWLFGAIIGVGIGLVTMFLAKSSYEGSILFTLSAQTTSNQGSLPYYTYDGYYAKQSSVISQDDLAKWVKSTPITASILKTAGIDTSAYSIADLGRIFKVSESRTSNLEVTYGAASSAEAGKIAQALSEEVKSNFSLNGATIAASQPLVTEIRPNNTLMLVGAVIATTIMAFALSLVISYFRNE